MFSLFAKKNVLAVNQREVVTSGSVNVYEVQFQFDSEWDGLEKTAVFRAGGCTVSTLLDETETCIIPWEVFQDAKRTLCAGVYGTKNGNTVLPTIWASLGEIRQGCEPGESTQPPTPDVYSQILQVAKDAEDVAQSVRDDADSGKFKGETGETPDITAGTVETLEPGQDATAEITGETPNLVLNLGIPKGQPGQDAPQIDDDVVSATNPWSSLKIVDTLAPPFSSSGAIVTCNPVAGYPLHVVSQIMPVQEGSGDPGPENVRPISGWTEATLTHNDTPITLSFGQTVYGGTLDWTTGVLTIHFKYLELNSAYDYFVYDSPKYPKGVSCKVLDARYNLAEAICSHGECMQNFVSDKPSYFWIGANNPDVYWVGIMDELGFNSLEEFKSWLDTQDVQIVYKTQNPITIQLTQQEILALSGTNTIYTDTGDTTVSGRADPNTIIQQLAARIAALEEQAING